MQHGRHGRIYSHNPKQDALATDTCANIHYLHMVKRFSQNCGWGETFPKLQGRQCLLSARGMSCSPSSSPYRKSSIGLFPEATAIASKFPKGPSRYEWLSGGSRTLHCAPMRQQMTNITYKATSFRLHLLRKLACIISEPTTTAQTRRSPLCASLPSREA